MSEFPVNQDERLLQMRQSLQRATESVCGDPNADPLSVFPNPATKERREDVLFDVRLTPEQENAFRSAMAEMGPGREESVGASELGLPHGYNAVLEGGQPHKMIAELRLVLENDVQPRQIIVTGSSGRKLGDQEKEQAAKLLGIDITEVGDTEFDVACQVVKRHPKYEPFPEGAEGFLGGDPSRIHAEYDLAKDPDMHSISIPRSENTGQFVQLGTIDGGKPVIAIRVDRFPDPKHPDDKTKYIQPSNSQKIAFAWPIISAKHQIDYGFDAINNTVLVTSATYEPSCTLSAMEAEEKHGRLKAHVISYGTKLLAEVKGSDPVPPSLDQLAAEAYKVAKLLENKQES